MLIGFKQVNAQMGIGTSNPENSAQLDVSSSKKGILLPRISLNSTKIQAPVKEAATSLLVYNIATINDVTPGFYYWDGTQWIRMARSDESTFDALTDTQKASLKGEKGNPGIAGAPGAKGERGDKGDSGSGSGGAETTYTAGTTYNINVSPNNSSGQITLKNSNLITNINVATNSRCPGMTYNSIASFVSSGDLLVFLGGSAENVPFSVTYLASNSIKLTAYANSNTCSYSSVDRYDFTITKSGTTLTIVNNNQHPLGANIYIISQN